MAKVRTINEKLLKDIRNIIVEEASISNIPEFHILSENKGVKLFDQRPDRWSELEIAIYEYTERIVNNIDEKIEKLLINEK